ncbi:accessory gene regulator ArgB-like protein [Cohnella candidum]|uniref:Accessory regulator AgrB n=1 Tax=Cohnella candidum TaxID=2674991 RepID=A0A3G3JVF7_9BACL|nr:accessory gene regulator B family protein [Cohnella candidum]AYQ71837.1 hypothetical protein EAV92_04195 [Cohnella candidum]
MIERWAASLAVAIRNNGGDERVSVDVLRFSAILILGTLFILFGTGIVGLIFSRTADAYLVLAVIGALRYFSGGWHMKTGMQCVFFTVGVVTAILLMPQLSQTFLWAINILSIFLNFCFSPTGNGQKIRSKKQWHIFKWISVAIVVFTAQLQDSIVSLSILCQSLTLVTMKRGEKDAEICQNSLSSDV